MNRPLWRPTGAHRRTPEAWAEMTEALGRLTAERDALAARVAELEQRSTARRTPAAAIPAARRMPIATAPARFQLADFMQGARAAKAAA